MIQLSLQNRSIACLLLGFSLNSVSRAATDVSPSEAAFFEDMPVVLTASRLAQVQSEAPNAITVIDRKMIEASAARSVPELLRWVPGMYVGFADANRPVVTLHGSADEYAHRMQVLVDGRSIFMPPFGSVSWSDLAVQLEDIERIEVVRGPSSASHGSNAFYGTINIITLNPQGQSGTQVAVRGGTSADVSVRTVQSTKFWDARLSVGIRSDDGLERGTLNDYNVTRLANLYTNIRPTPADDVQLQLGFTTGAYGLGIAGRPEDAFRETSSRSSFQMLRWNHLWSANDETQLSLTRSERTVTDPRLCLDSNACQYTGQRDEYPVSKYPTAGFFSQTNANARTEAEIQSTHVLGDAHRLVWGGGVRRDYADFSLLLAQPTNIDVWRLFVHDEWRLAPATVLNWGVMHENDGYGNTSNAPRISLNHHLTPQHTVRVAWSTATRSPIMFEELAKADNTTLGGLFVRPLSQLTPERIESVEIGYLGEFPQWQSSVDVRLYREHLRDQIWYDKFVVVTDNPNSRTSPDSFKNLFSADFSGLEVAFKRHWDDRRSFAAINYAYQESSASLSATPTQYYSTAPFPGYPSWGSALQWYYATQYLALYPQATPKHSLGVLVSQAMPLDWQLSASYFLRSEMRVGDVSDDVAPESLMRRLDLKLTRKFRWSSEVTGEVSAVVQNVTRDPYTKYGTLNATAELPFERRGWLGLRLSF